MGKRHVQSGKYIEHRSCRRSVVVSRAIFLRCLGRGTRCFPGLRSCINSRCCAHARVQLGLKNPNSIVACSDFGENKQECISYSLPVACSLIFLLLLLLLKVRLHLFLCYFSALTQTHGGGRPRSKDSKDSIRRTSQRIRGKHLNRPQHMLNHRQAQALQRTEVRGRTGVGMSRLAGALNLLAHVVVLTCSILELARRQLPQGDSHDATPLRIDVIYHWSLPVVWAASLVVRLTKQ